MIKYEIWIPNEYSYINFRASIKKWQLAKWCIKKWQLAKIGELAANFANFRQFSPTFANIRQLSPIFANCHFLIQRDKQLPFFDTAHSRALGAGAKSLSGSCASRELPTLWIHDCTDSHRPLVMRCASCPNCTPMATASNRACYCKRGARSVAQLANLDHLFVPPPRFSLGFAKNTCTAEGTGAKLRALSARQHTSGFRTAADGDNAHQDNHPRLFAVACTLCFICVGA